MSQKQNQINIELSDEVSKVNYAKEIIKEFAETSWRPWFRAPGGYIAPWMAEILKLEKFELDSSINPTKFLSIKSGKFEKGFGFNGL